MTYLEFAHVYDRTLTDDMVYDILWNETAYPMAGLKMVANQIRAAIRRRRNGIIGCELCGRVKCRCREVLTT